MADTQRPPVALAVRDLHAWYGKGHVLHGVSLDVAAGECVCLVGRNGVGRSTTLKAVMGLVQASGSARFRGLELIGQRTVDIARAGVGYVPENRDVFPALTVRENLLLGEQRGRGSLRWTMDELLARFPRLAERADTPAGVLSGGEQQMLTLCRTLMGNPDLVMIDEPTEGLAPQGVEAVAALFAEIKRRGVSILLVEQRLTIALELSERLYVMGHGRIVFEGTPASLRADAAVRQEWLEV
jgi:branched-chain amino acid transport system ATP-binding protein